MGENEAQSQDGSDSGALRNTIYRRLTRSQRRMGPVRRALYSLLAPAGLALVRLWWRSCRVVAIVGEENVDAALARAPSFLPCYWHQHQLFCAYYLLRAQAKRRLRVGFLISPSVDGELGAMIIRRAGGVVIRGSSSHTGALALKGYFEALMREQVSPVINPDGPRGPRFKFKPGAVMLAQLSGRAMVPMAYAASRAWLIHWDRFVLPMPLSRIAIAIGAPRVLPRVLDAEAMQNITQDMERLLHDTYRSARAALEVGSPTVKSAG
jgi:lysophospholipid acyltransferase (LPLAT)-like uncharacterized protein